MKTNPFRLLIYLIAIDIILTLIAVGFFDAIEINPMCGDFSQFITIKLIISTVGLLALSRMRNYPTWKTCTAILTIVYTVVFLFNLTGIARSIV